MPGFDYTPIDPTPGSPVVPQTDRQRQYLNLYKGRCRVAELVLPGGVSGPVSFTGLGMNPDVLFISGVLLPDSVGVYAQPGFFHFGVADGTDQWGVGLFVEYLLSTKAQGISDDHVFFCPDGLGGQVSAQLSSFDPDGFTLDVDNPPSVDVSFIAMVASGGGRYKCGTGTAPGGTGHTSVTGVGWTPEALITAGTFQTSFGVQTGLARMFLGGADPLTSSYLAWSGSASGNPYTDQSIRGPGFEWLDPLGVPVCISFLANSPPHPLTHGEASLYSMDADGFTLNWNVAPDGGYKYGWLACEKGEVDAWTYNDSLVTGVNTRNAPKGIYFFNNNRGGVYKYAYPLGHNPPNGSFGAALATGFCDKAGNQFRNSYIDVTEPPFGAPQTARHQMAEAFGSFPQQSSSIASNFGLDRGYVTFRLGETRFRPQIYRRVVGG